MTSTMARPSDDGWDKMRAHQHDMGWAEFFAEIGDDPLDPTFRIMLDQMMHRGERAPTVEWIASWTQDLTRNVTEPVARRTASSILRAKKMQRDSRDFALTRRIVFATSMEVP